MASSAADTGAATPATLVLTTARAKKGAVAKGAAGLVSAKRKGPSPFVRLLGAKLAVKGKGAALKEALAVAQAKGAAAAAKAQGRAALPLAPHGHLPEKPQVKAAEDGTKKPVHHEAAHGSSAHPGAPVAPAAAAILPAALEAAKQAAPAAVPHAAQAAAARGAPVIHVIDLRRKAEPAHLAEGSPGAQPGPLATSLDRDASIVSVPSRLVFAPAVAHETHRQAAVPTAQTPLERLREMAGNELMKAATMVLRDGGGEIRLVLKPESLGSVRVRMHLSDNSIEGKIIVDNQAVKQVIDGNLDSLMRSLRAEGFQAASLQVSVGGQNMDNGRQAQEAPSVPRAVARAEHFERNIPGVENVSLGDRLVNLFV